MHGWCFPNILPQPSEAIFFPRVVAGNHYPANQLHQRVEAWLSPVPASVHASYTLKHSARHPWPTYLQSATEEAWVNALHHYRRNWWNSLTSWEWSRGNIWTLKKMKSVIFSLCIYLFFSLNWTWNKSREGHENTISLLEIRSMYEPIFFQKYNRLCLYGQHICPGYTLSIQPRHLSSAIWPLLFCRALRLPNATERGLIYSYMLRVFIYRADLWCLPRKVYFSLCRAYLTLGQKKGCFPV
jgi:hypothetical protein